MLPNKEAVELFYLDYAVVQHSVSYLEFSMADRLLQNPNYYVFSFLPFLAIWELYEPKDVRKNHEFFRRLYIAFLHARLQQMDYLKTDSDKISHVLSFNPNFKVDPFDKKVFEFLSVEYPDRENFSLSLLE